MKTLLCILAALLLLPVAAFCVFGFMATFEPTNRPGVFIAFRIGYAVVGVGCLVAVVALFAKAFRSGKLALLIAFTLLAAATANPKAVTAHNDGDQSRSETTDQLKLQVTWDRDERNPILPLGDSGTFDSKRCMNPWVLRVGDDYHLYYAGSDDRGIHRICLATAPADDLSIWKRRGPLFDVGPPGSFDAKWCVLPHVVQMAPDRWHLYYTGNSGRGAGLSAFPGIGLAVSRDGKKWEKYPGNPVLERTGNDGDPDAVGIAGGSVLKATKPDGSSEWRFYYTGCPTLGKELRLNQQKRICYAVSQDGIAWRKRGAIMVRDPQRDYEDVGVAGPVVQQLDDGTYRMWYSAIGTKWGYYSICYGESEDGITWRRGEKYGDNLQLTPHGSGWEKQMVEYPSIIREGGRLRLFYCGNGYGQSGIGTAISSPIRPNE